MQSNTLAVCQRTPRLKTLRLAFLNHNREPGNDKITHLQRGKWSGQKKRPCVAGPFSNNWGNEPFGA
jgi:hypothetical protein